MTKKIFLILTMILIMSCLFVVTSNAEVTTYDDAPTRTNYQCIDAEIIEFYDGFTCPVSYVFKDTSTIGTGNYNTKFENFMDFTYINEKLGKTEADGNLYTYADVKGFDIPTGITHVAKYAGLDGKTLKWITFPSTITSLSNAIFQNATALEECTLKFTKDNPMRVFPSYMFFGCKNLKAFSMPDCFTSLYDVAHFSGCINLGAVHLSESLETWSSGGGGSRTATFDDCNNMYFVNETFTYDAIPEKPTVYYFPKNLTTITNNSVCRECRNLNDVLVFGEKLTTMPNMYFFQNGPANKIVFLGDMTTVSTQYWGKTTHIYFANKNDVDLSSVSFSGGKTAVFCNAPGNTTHLSEKTVDVEAKCEVDAGKYTYCFCGQVISIDAVEGTALSHDYDYTNGNATLVAITYADLSKVGTKTVKCGLCGVDNDTIVADKVFTYKGYSTNEKGSMCMGYIIDQDALNEYELLNGKVNYGFVAAANNDTPIDENGENKENTVKVSLDENVYTAIDFVLTATNWDNEAVSNVKITLNMYVIVNNIVKYVTANGYNDVAEAYKYSEI